MRPVLEIEDGWVGEGRRRGSWSSRRSSAAACRRVSRYSGGGAVAAVVADRPCELDAPRGLGSNLDAVGLEPGVGLRDRVDEGEGIFRR